MVLAMMRNIGLHSPARVQTETLGGRRIIKKKNGITTGAFNEPFIDMMHIRIEDTSSRPRLLSMRLSVGVDIS